MYVGHVGKDLRPVPTTIPSLHPSTNIRLHHGKLSATKDDDGNQFSYFQESQTHMPRCIPQYPHSVLVGMGSCNAQAIFRLIQMARRPCEVPPGYRLYRSGRSISITTSASICKPKNQQAELASLNKPQPQPTSQDAPTSFSTPIFHSRLCCLPPGSISFCLGHAAGPRTPSTECTRRLAEAGDYTWRGTMRTEQCDQPGVLEEQLEH